MSYLIPLLNCYVFNWWIKIANLKVIFIPSLKSKVLILIKALKAFSFINLKLFKLIKLLLIWLNYQA